MTQQLPPGIKNWRGSPEASLSAQLADTSLFCSDWRTKGCEAWAKTWLKTEIDGVEVDGVSVSVKDTEGDCEVGMRKSKCVMSSRRSVDGPR